MKKYIFLTNIPTPYRTSFYNDLFMCGLNFEVMYMRSTEGDRSWNIDPKLLKHPFYIDKSYYMMLGRYHLHINPKIVIKMIKDKNAEFIIGGSWNDINVLLLVLLKRLKVINNVFHFWSEANYLTIGSMKDNLIKRLVRKFVFNSSTGFQISSGKMTELTFEKWGIRNKKFINLPNTIEEDKFIITSEKISERENNSLPIFFLPVRLIESIKGIINFLSSIGNENVRKGIFLIAGDGPDNNLIRSYIKSQNLNDHVKLLGHCNIDQIIQLYTTANVFVLPSFSDPSPLSVIEALRMRLPILISDRCGNHFEAVDEKINGYLFDPSKPNSIKNAFELLMKNKNNWKSMGEESGIIYDKSFKKDKVITEFIQGLTPSTTY